MREQQLWSTIVKATSEHGPGLDGLHKTSELLLKHLSQITGTFEDIEQELQETEVLALEDCDRWREEFNRPKPWLLWLY